MHIGIDLGTTFCCAAYIDEGNPTVIPDNLGRELTPSVVWFDGKTAYVGETANKKKVSITPQIKENFKRDMGKSFEERPYKVNGISFGAIGISAILVRKIRRDAWQFFKKKKLIDENLKETDFKIDAVISVPAYFGDQARQATKCAGELAGLNVIGIINEPTAASLTYGFSINEDKKILVFDLGGGTIDVTILEIVNGEFKVIGTDGNAALGGIDWDKIIIELVEGEFKKQTGAEISFERSWDIKEQAIQAKKTLSENPETTIFVSDNGYDIELKLFSTSPDKDSLEINDDNNFYFDERCSYLLSTCSARCLEVLKKANLRWGDIEEIVLAGGSCRMPMIPAMLEELSGKQIRKHREGFSYDTAIAIGAALSGQSRGRIKDVTPKSIGIKLTKNGRDFIDHLIYKDTPLPATSQKEYKTDPYAILEVYEGESKVAESENFRGKLELENTQEYAKIILEVDENGILKVLADYQPEGIKEAKINGSNDCPEHLRKIIQNINLIS